MLENGLKGILPPLTTPFTERGEIDYAALAGNISHYNEAGLSGYVALGSNGEAVHLDASERDAVIATIRRAARPDHIVIAGVNELSTRAAIEATRRAAEAGADVALVVTPYFYKSAMTGAALERHFQEVADQSPIPILIYNVPRNTGVVIESAVIARLAEHPRIAGVKDSAGNFGAISETLRLAPRGFAVFSGNGGILYPALAMGAVGAILAVACAAPRAAVEIYEAVAAGDHARASDLQRRLSPLSHAVTARYGVAGLKAALDMAGLRGGPPRAPLTATSEKARREIRAIMRETGFFPELE